MPRNPPKTRGRDFAVRVSVALALTALGPAFAHAADAVPAAPPLPELGFSLARLFGALVLVLALFLGGVWLFRNWQRLAVYKGRKPRLNILEVKSLGSRHALYLVSYEQQRFLISSSPAGINLLTHLPEAGADEAAPEGAPAPPSFAESLRRVLAAKT